MALATPYFLVDNRPTMAARPYCSRTLQSYRLEYCPMTVLKASGLITLHLQAYEPEAL